MKRKKRKVASAALRVQPVAKRASSIITGQAPGVPIALHRSATGKISVGNISVDFYVLDNGSRVVDMGGAEAALGFGPERLMRIPGIIEHMPSSVGAMARQNLQFRENERSAPKPCVLAEVMIHLCAAVLAARRPNPKDFEYKIEATLSELFLSEVATRSSKVFVDVITGSRMPGASPKEETGMLTTVSQPYARTYPDEYFEELYRLRGLGPVPSNARHPAYFGNLNNNIVYKRFAPGVLAALKDKTIRDDTGKHKKKLFQLLSPEKQTELQEDFLPAVIAIMKTCETFDEFMEKLDKRYPVHRNFVKPKR